MMDLEQTSLLIRALLTLLSALITVFVIPWLKNKINAQKLNAIIKYTEIAVRCAEQIFTSDEWREKKNYVLQYITTKAAKVGIDMSVEDIDNLIEGIVNEVKRG